MQHKTQIPINRFWPRNWLKLIETNNQTREISVMTYIRTPSRLNSFGNRSTITIDSRSSKIMCVMKVIQKITYLGYSGTEWINFP